MWVDSGGREGDLFSHYESGPESIGDALAERDANASRGFGRAVSTFNGGVDRLNERWRQAVAADFGVPPATYPQDATSAQITRADERRADQVLDAKIDLLKELVLEHKDLCKELGQAASERLSWQTRSPWMVRARSSRSTSAYWGRSASRSAGSE